MFTFLFLLPCSAIYSSSSFGGQWLPMTHNSSAAVCFRYRNSFVDAKWTREREMKKGEDSASTSVSASNFRMTYRQETQRKEKQETKSNKKPSQSQGARGPHSSFSPLRTNFVSCHQKHMRSNYWFQFLRLSLSLLLPYPRMLLLCIIHLHVFFIAYEGKTKKRTYKR